MNAYHLLLAALLLVQGNAFSPVTSRANKASVSRLAAQEKESVTTVPITPEEDEFDDFDMDFEARFEARLQEEGGLEGLKAKAAQRERDEQKKKIMGQLNQLQGDDKAILVVCAVVLLIVGLAVSSPEPFERTTDGQQLYFGIR
jgi:hypothetical protein